MIFLKWMTYFNLSLLMIVKKLFIFFCQNTWIYGKIKFHYNLYFFFVEKKLFNFKNDMYVCISFNSFKNIVFAHTSQETSLFCDTKKSLYNFIFWKMKKIYCKFYYKNWQSYPQFRVMNFSLVYDGVLYIIQIFK